MDDSFTFCEIGALPMLSKKGFTSEGETAIFLRSFFKIFSTLYF
jgi:hypothetical protein